MFHDFKHGESFGVLSLFSAEQGIVSKPWHRLASDDWWEAVTVARDGGAPIPEYDGPQTGESEPTPVLPDSDNVAGATGGWDWRHTATHDRDSLTIEDARERTRTAIARAYNRRENVLIEALPTMGKSYGSVAAAADTVQSVTILTGRGRKEQYDQLREWCKEHNLDYYTLPSFTHDCLTANGEHGDDWRETVMDWYRRGARPQEIHKSAEYILDRPLPCQVHDGQRCPYASKWDFDPDEYDILIGHYAHAYKPKVTTGRAVVFDEFPDAYETKLGPQLQGAVSHWLEQTDEMPFDEWTDLIERRDDDRLRAGALQWFAEHDVDVDEGQVFEDPSAHASAPLAVFTLLASNDLGNGFETADLEDLGTGVYNRQNTSMSLLRPPALEYATSVVALDGTPTKEMWELSLGIHLSHRPVLDDRERSTYIEEALNLNLVRTTEYVKPYNSSDHVNVDSDAALLEKIAAEHGEEPSLITTSTAEHEYDVAGVE